MRKPVVHHTTHLQRQHIVLMQLLPLDALSDSPTIYSKRMRTIHSRAISRDPNAIDPMCRIARNHETQNTLLPSHLLAGRMSSLSFHYQMATAEAYTNRKVVDTKKMPQKNIRKS